MELPLKMRQEYLSRRRTDLEALRSQTTPFKVLGHQMRGNARSYGFDSLEPIAIRMESINESSPKQSIDRLIAEFEEWIENEEKKISV